MEKSFEITEVFPALPSAVYYAWLNSEEHTLMTGGEAICGDREGETFSA